MQSLQTVTAASVSEESIAALRVNLRRNIDKAQQWRRTLAERIAESDDAALCALRDHSTPLVIYAGGFSKQILVELDAESDDQQAQEKALNYFVRKHELWLEGWSPSTGSTGLMLVHAGAEYEAVKAMLRLLREALNPKSEPSKPKKQTKK